MNTHIQYMDECRWDTVTYLRGRELFPHLIKGLMGFLLATPDMVTISVMNNTAVTGNRGRLEPLGKQEVIGCIYMHRITWLVVVLWPTSNLF